jgi:hypothetical protein
MLFRASHLGSGAPPDRTYGWWPLNYRPPAPDGFIGIAEDIPGRVAMGGDLENIEEAQVVFAHEIGHTYGLCHTNYESSCYAGHWDNHETGFTSVPETGFDTTLMKSVVGSTDFMKSHVGPNYWIHPQRYFYLMQRLASREADPANARGCHHYSDCVSLVQNSLLVTGAIDSDGSVRLDPVYAAESIPDEVPSSPAASEYRLQALNEAGEVLYDYPLATGGNSSFENDAEQDTTFSVVLPSQDGLATLRVVRDGEAAAMRAVTEGSLGLEIVSPAGGELFGDLLQVTWACTAHDEKEMSYAVLYRAEAGGEFQALGVDLSDTNFLYDASKLPGGDAAVVRVVATDGVSTVSADSAPFRIAKKKPAVAILSPRDGQTFYDGTPIPLAAEGTDLEDGLLPPESLRWESDRAGDLGFAAEISATLPVGTHVLTVAAPDGDGNASEASVTVHVVEGASSPRADGGGNRTVDEREDAALDASESSDPDEGDSLAYLWEQVKGPNVVLDDPTGPVATFTAPDVHADTQLRFRLTVTDAQGHTGTDFVDVFVKNVFYPSLRISHELLDFGNLATGDESSQTITVTNEGNEALEVRNAVASRPAFTAEPGAFSLAPGESRSVTITFAPEGEAKFDSNLRFVTNTVPGSRTMVFLKATTKAPDKSFRDNGLGGNLLPQEEPGEDSGTFASESPLAAPAAGGCALARDH